MGLFYCLSLLKSYILAYAKKYESLFASQNGSIITVELYENDYAGAVIQYPCNLFNLQYLPSGDDPFEPIYASQIECVLDVTNNIANMPDFTTLNDRKYHVKVLKDATLLWQGWALSDDVNYLFSTGREEIQFNAVCGLGMLKDVDFATSSTDFRNTIMHYLTNALGKVNYPTAANILSSCGIFSSGMDNTLQPWTQAYMAYNNFVLATIDSEGITRNTYSCLDVLRSICTSWGCRIFMCNGEWNIVQVNQLFDTSRAWIRYDSTGAVVTSGTFTTNKNVPADLIFINGDQNKIYKKGFNNFLSEKDIEFAQNYIFNADLKLYSGSDATLWTRTTSGSGYATVQVNADKNINAWILALGDVTTGALAQVENLTPMPITQGDVPTVQFRIYATTANLDGGGVKLPNCLMRLIIGNGVITYFLDDANTWQVLSMGGNNYYKVGYKEADTLVNLEKIPPAPISGTMYFGVLVRGSGTNTQTAIIVGDFEVSYNALLQKITMTAKINNVETYRKKIEFPHGYNSDNLSDKPAFLGAITDTGGVSMYGWYMIARSGVDSFQSLAHLMFKNYINMYRKNIINVDATIEGYTTALDVYTFDDTDPAQVNVGSKKYMIGNSVFMPIPNELQCTFLEVDNTPQTITITTVYDNGVEPGIAFSMAGGAVNKPGACALVTYTLTKYATSFLPTIGDTIYNEANLQTTFAGSGIWWKLYSPYYNTVRALLINSSGVITDSQTC